MVLIPDARHCRGESIAAHRLHDDGDRRWLATVLPVYPAGKPFSYAMQAAGATFVEIPYRIPSVPTAGISIVMLDEKLLTGHRIDFRSKSIFFPIGPTGEIVHPCLSHGDRSPARTKIYRISRRAGSPSATSTASISVRGRGNSARIRETDIKSSSKGLCWRGLGPGRLHRAGDRKSSARIVGPVTFYRNQGLADHRLRDRVDVMAGPGDLPGNQGRHVRPARGVLDGRQA